MAPKTGLLLALAGPKEGKAEAKEQPAEEAGGDSSAERLEAAQALLDALEAKDAKGVDTALQAHWMACQEEDDSDEEAPASGRY